jgi:hypothetical protein
MVFSYGGPEMAKGDGTDLFREEEYEDYGLGKLLGYQTVQLLYHGP